MSTEHAGFLMGLGLNGHLRDMPFMNIYEYLVKCNEMISVGLLLGLAATYRGTLGSLFFKYLRTYILYDGKQYLCSFCKALLVRFTGDPILPTHPQSSNSQIFLVLMGDADCLLSNHHYSSA